MNRIFSAVIEMSAASIFIIPIFSVYGKFAVKNIKRTFIYFLFGLYLSAMLALVGFPNVKEFSVDFTINIIPIVYIIPDFVNASLNVILFVPFGIFLSLLWKKFRNKKSLVKAALCMSAVIEIAQIFTYRTTDINDVITNTTGAMIGYLIAKTMTAKFTACSEFDSDSRDLYFIVGIVILVMVLLQPFISSILWSVLL